MLDLLPSPLHVADASAKLHIETKTIAAILPPEIETYPSVPGCLMIVGVLHNVPLHEDIPYKSV